jgi:hypothetical protein
MVVKSLRHMEWEFLYKNSSKRTYEVGKYCQQDVYVLISYMLFNRCVLTGLSKIQLLMQENILFRNTLSRRHSVFNFYIRKIVEKSEICQRSNHSCHGHLCSGAAYQSGRITNSSKTKFTSKVIHYTYLCDKFYKSVV